MAIADVLDDGLVRWNHVAAYVVDGVALLMCHRSSDSAWLDSSTKRYVVINEFLIPLFHH